MEPTEVCSTFSFQSSPPPPKPLEQSWRIKAILLSQLFSFCNSRNFQVSCQNQVINPVVFRYFLWICYAYRPDFFEIPYSALVLLSLMVPQKEILVKLVLELCCELMMAAWYMVQLLAVYWDFFFLFHIECF